LSCDVKLEPMPEGKAPRMLIADGDEGQVLALLTICCIEDLIKKHMPKKTIKGLGKRKAMERIAAELRVPNAAYSKTSKGPAQSTERSGQNGAPGASVFELMDPLGTRHAAAHSAIVWRIQLLFMLRPS